MFPYTLCSHVHVNVALLTISSDDNGSCIWEHNVYGNISMGAKHFFTCNDCCERSEDNESRVCEHHVNGNILMGSQYLQLLLEYDVFRGQWDVCMGP